MSFSTMEDAMDYLKDFPHNIELPIQIIFDRACEFTQVTPSRLK